MDFQICSNDVTEETEKVLSGIKLILHFCLNFWTRTKLSWFPFWYMTSKKKNPFDTLFAISEQCSIFLCNVLQHSSDKDCDRNLKIYTNSVLLLSDH